MNSAAQTLDPLVPDPAGFSNSHAPTGRTATSSAPPVVRANKRPRRRRLPRLVVARRPTCAPARKRQRLVVNTDPCSGQDLPSTTATAAATATTKRYPGKTTLLGLPVDTWRLVAQFLLQPWLPDILSLCTALPLLGPSLRPDFRLNRKLHLRALSPPLPWRNAPRSYLCHELAALWQGFPGSSLEAVQVLSVHLTTGQKEARIPVQPLETQRRDLEYAGDSLPNLQTLVVTTDPWLLCRSPWNNPRLRLPRQLVDNLRTLYLYGDCTLPVLPLKLTRLSTSLSVLLRSCVVKTPEGQRLPTPILAGSRTPPMGRDCLLGLPDLSNLEYLHLDIDIYSSLVHKQIQRLVLRAVMARSSAKLKELSVRMDWCALRTVAPIISRASAWEFLDDLLAGNQWAGGPAPPDLVLYRFPGLSDVFEHTNTIHAGIKRLAVMESTSRGIGCLRAFPSLEALELDFQTDTSRNVNWRQLLSCPELKALRITTSSLTHQPGMMAVEQCEPNLVKLRKLTELHLSTSAIESLDFLGRMPNLRLATIEACLLPSRPVSSRNLFATDLETASAPSPQAHSSRCGSRQCFDQTDQDAVHAARERLSMPLLSLEVHCSSGPITCQEYCDICSCFHAPALSSKLETPVKQSPILKNWPYQTVCQNS